jgi:antitoxin ParD1/3/4
MSRQSISFTRPNDEWLRAQVNSEEFTSKSDVVNDLIRRAREIETIRARLIAAEQGGFTDLTPEQIRQRVRERLSDGEDV